MADASATRMPDRASVGADTESAPDDRELASPPPGPAELAVRGHGTPDLGLLMRAPVIDTAMRALITEVKSSADTLGAAGQAAGDGPPGETARKAAAAPWPRSVTGRVLSRTPSTLPGAREPGTTATQLCRQSVRAPVPQLPARPYPAGAPRMAAARWTCHRSRRCTASRARIHDRGGDLRLLGAAWACQAAIWYSCVSPPRTCCRWIRCSARLISGCRRPACAGASWSRETVRPGGVVVPQVFGQPGADGAH
jgi:hypothetical protein